jgi:hypothetical protein
LSFKELKKGKFIEANTYEKATLMNTMLTDIPDRLWVFCKRLNPDVERKVIKPNGFFSGTFVFEYVSKDFKIKITRKLDSWQGIFKAELPESYKIIVDVKSNSYKVSDKIRNFLKSITKDRESIFR